MLTAVQVLVAGLVPAAGIQKLTCSPPHTIISLPVHTAVWKSREAGALVMLVAVQLFVLGLYLPPVLDSPWVTVKPPHTINLSARPNCCVA